MSSRKPADKYLLDTNVVLDIKRHWGEPPEGQEVWDWFVQMILAGLFQSVETVRTEIRSYRRKDGVTRWVNSRDERFFLEHTDREESALVGKIVPVLESNGYSENAVGDFIVVADGHLVVRAAIDGHIVVTSEISEDTLSKVKIPDACRLVGVECIDLDTLLEREKAKFRRGSKDAKGK